MDLSITSPVVQFDQNDLNDLSLIDATAGIRARYLVTALNPVNFQHYLEQAERSYGRYEVACAVRRTELDSHTCPSFWQIEELRGGALLGGVRNHGPYRNVQSVWAWQELADSGRAEELRPVIEQWLEAGRLVEQKGAYVHVDAPLALSRALTAMFKRLVLATIDLIAAETMVASSAEHTMALWRGSGFEVVRPDIHAPYPDNRYRTVLICNRRGERAKRLHPTLCRQAELDVISLRGQLARRRVRQPLADTV